MFVLPNRIGVEYRRTSAFELDVNPLAFTVTESPSFTLKRPSVSKDKREPSAATAQIRTTSGPAVMTNLLFSRTMTASITLPLIEKLEPPTSVGGRSIEESCGTVDDVVEEVDDVGDVEEVELVATDAAPVRGVLVLVVEDTTEICPCPIATVVGDTTGVVVKETPAGATVVDGLVEVVFTDVLIVMVLAVTAEVGPVFEAASATELAPSLTMTVPSLVHVTETLTATFAVLAAGVAAHPVAVPVREKSPAAIEDTTSENVNV